MRSSKKRRKRKSRTRVKMNPVGFVKNPKNSHQPRKEVAGMVAGLSSSKQSLKKTQWNSSLIKSRNLFGEKMIKSRKKKVWKNQAD